MVIEKNDKQYTVGFGQPRGPKKDIACFNPLEIKEAMDPAKFDWALCFVPFCEQSDQLRISSKLIRAFCEDKFNLIDVDQTYPFHKAAKLSHKKMMSTRDLAIRYFESEGFTILEEENAS